MDRGMQSKHVRVSIDLDRVRANAERIRRETGVALIAVLKGDAYGLGARAVAAALRDIADEFAWFSLDEARAAAHAAERPGLVLGPPDAPPEDYAALRLRPTVFTAEHAARYRGIDAALGIDTGMQRFGCTLDQAASLFRGARITDLATHAATREAAARLLAAAEAIGARSAGRGPRLHAASTSLLPHRECWLDAVRPGLALYRGALRVSTRLASVRAASGPVGYTGFTCSHVGIILAGYCNRLAPATALINGRRQRVLEVGMNSAFVSVDPADRAGDEVVLLGDGLAEPELAADLGVREHEVLCRYGAIGPRRYVGEAAGLRAARRSRAAARVTPPPAAVSSSRG